MIREKLLRLKAIKHDDIIVPIHKNETFQKYQSITLEVIGSDLFIHFYTENEYDIQDIYIDYFEFIGYITDASSIVLEEIEKLLGPKINIQQETLDRLTPVYQKIFKNL